MRANRWLLLVFTSALLTCSAATQSGDDNSVRCASQDPDVRIAGCTAVIQAGIGTTSEMANAFTNRCAGYNRKGQYDRAIVDCDQAIKVDPNYSQAFVDRGVAYLSKSEYDRAI
jgi:Tfp pilus assembly protein PilF